MALSDNRGSKIGFITWAGVLFFGTGLLLLAIPSGENWQRTEFASHICVLISAMLVVRARYLPDVPRAILYIWVIFGTGVLFSGMYTSESIVELVQVIRKVWLIPTVLLLVSYSIHTRWRTAWWTIFSVFACLTYGLMVFSLRTTPEGVYVPSIGGYTGKGARVFLHVLDGTLPLIGPAVLAAAFPMGAMTIAILAANRKWYAYAGVLGLFAYCALALVVGTRTGLLATLGASILVLAIFLIRARRIATVLTIGLCALLFIVGFFQLVESGAVSPEMADRFALPEISESSFTGRTHIWDERIQTIKSNFTGVGYYNATFHGIQVLSSHNIYLEAFYSLGWLAGASYAGFVGIVLAWAVYLALLTPKWRAALPLLWTASMFASYGLMDAIFVSSLLMHYTIFVCFGGCLAELHSASNFRTDYEPGSIRSLQAKERRNGRTRV